MNMYVLGLVIYFFIINLFAIFLMKYDKVKAINNQYRVRNKSDFVTPPLTIFVVSGIFKDVVFKFPPISRPLFSLKVVVLDHYPSQFLGLDYFFLYIFLIYLNFRLYLHLFLFLYLLQISLYLFFSFYWNFLL